MNTQTLNEKQAAKLAALQLGNQLETTFTELTGITPSIVSPGKEPFAVFYPKTKEDYLNIITVLQPTAENFKVTFAGKESIPTFSPYSIHYGGKHSTPNYMEVVVKFNHAVCPVWVKLPADAIKGKFSVSTMDGEHKGFGRYETLYTYKADGGTTVQRYYGENKTMYAANEAEAIELKAFINS